VNLSKETSGRLEAKLTRPTNRRIRLYITIRKLHPEGKDYSREFVFDEQSRNGGQKKAVGFKNFIQRVYKAGYEAAEKDLQKGLAACG